MSLWYSLSFLNWFQAEIIRVRITSILRRREFGRSCNVAAGTTKMWTTLLQRIEACQISPIDKVTFCNKLFLMTTMPKSWLVLLMFKSPIILTMVASLKGNTQYVVDFYTVFIRSLQKDDGGQKKQNKSNTQLIHWVMRRVQWNSLNATTGYCYQSLNVITF